MIPFHAIAARSDMNENRREEFFCVMIQKVTKDCKTMAIENGKGARTDHDNVESGKV